MNCSPPGSSAHGILQARILEWVAISSSRGSFQSKYWIHVSSTGRWVRFFTTGATGNPRSTGGSKHFILDGSSSPKRSTAQSEQELTETEISRGVDIDSIKILCSNTELWEMTGVRQRDSSKIVWALMRVTSCHTHRIRVHLGSEQCQHCRYLCKSTTLLTIWWRSTERYR